MDAESVQPPEDTAAVRQAGLGVPTLGTLQDVGEFLEFLSPLPWTQALGGHLREETTGEMAGEEVEPKRKIAQYLHP